MDTQADDSRGNGVSSFLGRLTPDIDRRHPRNPLAPVNASESARTHQSLDAIIDHTLWPALAVLIAVLALFEFTSLDLAIQDLLFDFRRSEWLLDAEEKIPRLILHELPTVLAVTIGLGLLYLLIQPAQWRRWFRSGPPSRRAILCAFLTLATVPLLIGAGKQMSNMFCPFQIERYGGDACYVRLFERHPAEDTDAGRGHCFPAGHASGPFALVGLLGLARGRRAQLQALWFAFACGWIAGGYQIVTGSHYVSHTLVTMLVAWIVFILWRRVLHVRTG